MRLRVDLEIYSMAACFLRVAWFLVALMPMDVCAGSLEADGNVGCRPSPEPTRAQYVVGYGSLMQDESRDRTAPHAGVARPVTVLGYQRGWYVASKGAGLGTTYLGVVRDAARSLNAVLYEIGTSELEATDQRERRYCRVLVTPSALEFLSGGDKPSTQAQIWIYEIRAGEERLPDEEHPLVQSYVDLFLAGCLEQELHFQLPGFAARCVRTTFGWSTHWVNDRLYPRRAYIFQALAPQIDELLAGEGLLYWALRR